jgi:hypothetical protein
MNHGSKYAFLSSECLAPLTDVSKEKKRKKQALGERTQIILRNHKRITGAVGVSFKTVPGIQ